MSTGAPHRPTRETACQHPETGFPHPTGLTGIDYLGLLAARHRRELEQRLRVTDPAGQLAALPPWHVVNIITPGQLLTAVPGG